MRSWPGSQIYSETFICSRYGSKCFKSQLKETKRPCRFIVVSMLVSFVPIICILGTWDITCLGVCGTQRESVLKALKIHRVRCHPAWNSGYSSSPLVVGLVFCGAHPHPRVVCWGSPPCFILPWPSASGINQILLQENQGKWLVTFQQF